MVEAATVHEMKAHVALVEAYRWHQISARRQDAALTSRVSGTGLGMNEALLQVDFKENVRYPLSKEETGDEWHAQNKLSLTVFGGFARVPNAQGTRTELYILIISEVLDHDAHMGNMMINEALRLVRSHDRTDWSKVDLLRIRINVLYLVEQHGKGACDRLFGWTRTWLTRFIQQSPVYKIADLLRCYEDGGRDMTARRGVRILNNVFSDLSNATRLSYEISESVDEDMAKRLL
ncbi:unnamed protein product [Symbiodinium sp. CCMP2456]|nr:unnamed protein product [Symbiodinium sp. CCMP2456]